MPTKLTSLFSLLKQSTKLLGLCLLLLPGKLQAQCTSDSLKVASNDKDWMVVANNFGAPNNVNAKIITYQYNSLPGSGASWISYTTEWIQNSIMSPIADDSFMTLRYSFKNCGTDSVRFNLQVRRDNYCNVTLDGTKLLMHDVPAVSSANYAGNQIDTTLFIDTCTHHLDFKVYNRADYTGINGFGLLVGGWLSSKTKILFTNAEGCDDFVCCRKGTAVSNTILHGKLQVYPNPAYDAVNVTLPAKTLTPSHYVLQNYLGQTVADGYLNNKGLSIMIDISRLNSGLYLLRIDGYSEAVKVLKQ